MSKRRRGFPSETHVKRGRRVVHGEKELIEKLGRNDPYPCGSGRRFQDVLLAERTVRWRAARPLLLGSSQGYQHSPGRRSPARYSLVGGTTGGRRQGATLALSLLALLVAVAAAALLFVAGEWGAHSGKAGSSSGLVRNGAAIRLAWPGALALDSHGSLYISDERRNQILTRRPDGSFRIVAGTGKAGFSGDGGSAVHAQLDTPRGMAIGHDGTLYFADEGNNRIRAVAPGGIISTVVGNGKYGWVRSGTPAHAATILSPGAVAVGPDGRLYIADSGGNEVLRLEANGTVTEIAGNLRYAGAYGVGGPAVRASPDGPSGLAFDRAGNLYLAGFNTKTLLMITPAGMMALPAGMAGFYPRGEGALVAAPNGHVYAADGQAIVRLTPHGIRPVVDFSRKSFDGIRGFLPQGVAVTTDRTIYTDTAVGNGYTNKTALVVVRPGGKLQVLWKG